MVNNNLKALYVAIVENEIVCFDTNLADFHAQFLKMEPTTRIYQWFYREFKKMPHFKLEISGKTYYFQKVV